jgi:hypothetical protein
MAVTIGGVIFLATGLALAGLAVVLFIRHLRAGGEDEANPKLADHLARAINSYRLRRTMHSWCGNTLLVLSIVASFALTVLSMGAADIELLPKLTLLTVLAALPGLFVTLNSTLKFHARAMWFDQMVTYLVIIDRELEVGRINELEAEERWSTLERQMQGPWEGIMRPTSEDGGVSSRPPGDKGKQAKGPAE